MSFEEPTQRLSIRPEEPAQTTAALPRPLDLAGPTPDATPAAPGTEELSLDQIFEPAVAEPAAVAPAADEAPTWTAMPVIPVRSEPVAPRGAPDAERRGEPRAERSGPSMGERLRNDAASAWDGAVRRSRAWLTRDDNGLMLMTAIVACLLILVVAAVG